MSLKKIFFLSFSLLSCLCEGSEHFFHRLQPNSLVQSSAYYSLYPETLEGDLAKQRFKRLVEKIGDVNRDFEFEDAVFSKKNCKAIIQLCDGFSNRKLQGYHASSIQQIQALESDQVDLSKALILHEFDQDSEEVLAYLAKIDLYTLNILASLPENPTIDEKIAAINKWIFDDLHIRFPPKSIFSKYIDQYTFLSKVMDNHLGVCLGVTTLYMCVAQRMGIDLKGVTPPGHIYLRYEEGDKLINIETTARGIHLNSESYEGVLSEKAPTCNAKQMIGMVFVNQAFVHLQNRQYDLAQQCYETALIYLPQDPLVMQLLGFCCIFQNKEGLDLLKEAKQGFENQGKKHELLEDFLAKKCDQEAIEACFMRIDDERDSIKAKKQALLKSLKKHPEFREGLEQLGVCYLQLGRKAEAIECFEKRVYEIQEDPTILYYLTSLYFERKDFIKSWIAFEKLLTHIEKKNVKPLRQLKHELIMHFPKPI